MYSIITIERKERERESKKQTNNTIMEINYHSTNQDDKMN